MKGFPKHLNTKADYEYARTHFPKSDWEQEFKNLLNTEDWFNIGTYDSKDNLTEDDTHRIIENVESNENGEEVVKDYGYYELQDNPMAKIYRIGYTKEEVTAILA